MSVSSYDAVAEKVLFDLELAINKYPAIDEFFIIPTLEEENKNSSPIVKGENTLGLESWIVTHIYPYAHHQIMQKNNYRTQNLCKVIPCLTGVALLNPDMLSVWNRRRELIISKKLQVDNELRLTKMVLSRKPKCNEALTHRRWIITEILRDVQDKSSLLAEELRLSEMIANRYHSNCHAWSHRMWSLQHLLPDSFHHSHRKPHKNCLYEMLSLEISQLINRAISRNEYSFLRNSEVSSIYFEELENNFKWISCHVSDHSGLHFRKFLISEIFSFIKNIFIYPGKTEFQSEYDYIYSNPHRNSIASMFNSGRINVKEFLTSFSYGAHHKRAVDEYLMNLDQELTFFDIVLFVVVTELKSNYSLCLLFTGHEALWYYRRYLVFLYKQLIDALDYCRENSENRIFLHQDSNGVPYRKDFKFDHSGESETIPKHSDFYVALYVRLISNEEEILSKANSQDDLFKPLLRNYSHWLRNCFRVDEHLL